jgi:Protein of unknown function (DUF3617)
MDALRTGVRWLETRWTQGMLGLACVLTVGSSMAAVDIPEFRQGMWEYERSVGGSKFVAKECGDPAQNMRAHNASMEKMGCKLSPAAQSGATYTYTTHCEIKLPSGVVSWSTTSVLTAEGEGAYRLEVHGSGRVQQDEVVVAHRVADCGK